MSRIYTDHGRVQRPVFVVERGELLIKAHHIKLLRVEIFTILTNLQSFLPIIQIRSTSMIC